MICALIVSDEVVIGFFTAVIVGQTAAIVSLWFYVTKLHGRCVEIEEKEKQ